MPITIKAHYNGTVIVPDETVDLPIDQPLVLEVKPQVSGREPAAGELTVAQRLERLAMASGRLSGPNIPDEALHREHLDEEQV